MAIVKVLEVIAESDKSWEDAAQQAVAEAARSVRNILNLYVKDMKAIVENNRIVSYRLNANITFRVEND